MLRPLAIALLTASVMTWIGPSLSLAQAEEVTASAPEETGQARQAVEALESQLIRADDSARPALLNRLRKAYSAAANEAEMAGQADEAEAYRINAAILNERLGQEPTESGQEPVASPPPALADPEAVPPSEPAPAPVREPETRKPAEKAPGVDLASLPASPPSAEPKPPAPSAAPDEAELLSKADDLYRSEKYSEAGAIYTRLASANHLPENRRNAWAYCRRFEVVKRINGQPRSEGEWAAIAAEITAIRQLSPSVWWFDVYLQDLVRERSGHVAKVAPRNDQVVLRGSQPEERPLALPRTGQPRTLTAPKPQVPAQKPSDTAGRPFSGATPAAKPAEMGPAETAPLPMRETGTLTAPPAEEVSTPPSSPPFQSPDLSQWQVENTTNFRIYHADADLARRVGRIAESTREEQIRRWTGQPPKGAWYPVCEIYLYPNAKIFSQRTDQPEDSPGFSTSGLMAGRVTARRINLRADHDKLEEAILPHEVTHIVLAELFAEKQIPRWADEGMAVLAEPSDEQRVRAQDLSKPLTGGRIFAVEQLLVMDYPDGQFWPLYYAQSISLTRFLVEASTPVRFVEFVKDAQRHGYDAALQRHYQMNGLEDLQTRWESYARSSLEVRTASSETETANQE